VNVCSLCVSIRAPHWTVQSLVPESLLAYALRGLAGVRESVGELVHGLTLLNRALVGGVHSALLSTANGLSISCAAGGAGRLRLTSCCGIWATLCSASCCAELR